MGIYAVTTLESRDYLLTRLKTFEEKYNEETILDQPTGVVTVCKENRILARWRVRLHDRFVFERQSINEAWTKTRLYP